jgi:hypothetical protein
MPPDEGAHCRYVADWVTVKLRWELTADPAEKDALVAAAAGCPNEPITMPPQP